MADISFYESFSSKKRETLPSLSRSFQGKELNCSQITYETLSTNKASLQGSGFNAHPAPVSESSRGKASGTCLSACAHTHARAHTPPS